MTSWHGIQEILFLDIFLHWTVKTLGGGITIPQPKWGHELLLTRIQGRLMKLFSGCLTPEVYPAPKDHTNVQIV